MCADLFKPSTWLRWFGAATIAAALALTGCSESKKPFVSIDITGAEFGKDFSLLDGEGKTRNLQSFKGQVVVLFFGYTQCPDVCPTTMAELVEAKRLLGAKGDNVVGLFVTLDPERDTPAVLKAYTANFGPSVIGLHAASNEQLAALTKDYRIYYKKVEGKGGQYTLDHTAASFIYDAQGRLRLYTRYGQGAQSLAADIALLSGS
jgi:protein SCO1/2